MANSTVRFDTLEFEAAHGRSPRGRGAWAFFFVGSDLRRTAAEFAPGELTFTEAKKWATERARTLGSRIVVVGS